MRRILSLGIVMLLAILSTAQRSGFKSDYSFAGGKYEVKYYSDSIVKITFFPANYKKVENLSDAVIMKTPIAFRQLFRISHDSVYLLDRPIIVGAYRSDTYAGFRFRLQNDEMIFGGGERALPLDRRGYRLNLYNNPWYGYAEGADNLNYSVPFITSSKGYGLFFDNPSKGYVDIGKADRDILEYGASSGEINVFIIIGNYQQVLQSYYKLTGTQPLPPRWALGNLMSRFGYTSEAQVKDILQKMKNEQVPVDAVIFDLFWFGDSIKHSLGNLDWVNREAWPDPWKMIRDFKKDGIQTILVTEPFFVESSRNYKASKPYLAVDSTGKPYYLTDFYFGKGGLIDIFRKDARQWFWQFYKRQMQLGVEAWWGDLGEPEKHPADLYHNFRDRGYKRLFSANEVHNIYGHEWTKMLYNFYTKEYPNKRLFSLNRAGFAGSQRYSIFPWTGDVSRSWSGLKAQLPILLGMSMSGIPYVHSDAGGFAGGNGDNELYVRWLQFAVFTPIFRPHGTALYEKDPSAFSFPSEAALIDTPFRSYAIAAIHERYSDLPYTYSLAYQQTKYGKPLMSPLYYYYPGDTTAVKIQNEYIWGENILVAPVLDKGVSEMRVYLPEGEWLMDKVYQGGQWVMVPVTIQRIPWFLKRGGFLPGATKKDESERSLTYFPASSWTNFDWYEDDGQSANSLKTGNFTLIKCGGVERGGKIEIVISSSNFKYAPNKFSLLVSGILSKPRLIIVNGKRYPVYDKAENIKGDNFAYLDAHGTLQITASLKKKLSVVITK